MATRLFCSRGGSQGETLHRYRPKKETGFRVPFFLGSHKFKCHRKEKNAGLEKKKQEFGFTKTYDYKKKKRKKLHFFVGFVSKEVMTFGE